MNSTETDVIAGLIHEIENLPKDQALERVERLEDNKDKTYFEMGGPRREASGL
jgi:hypothetical protein